MSSTEKQAPASPVRATAEEWEQGLCLLIDEVTPWLQKRGYSGVSAEERACLMDPTRVEEAQDMLSHWACRCGIPMDLWEALDEHVAIRPLGTPEQEAVIAERGRP